MTNEERKAHKREQFSRGCRVEAEMAEGMGKPVVEAEGIKE